jgi:GTP cyclohydrolase I
MDSAMVPPITAVPAAPASASALPDVAAHPHGQVTGCIEKVGMAGIEVPLRLRDDDGRTLITPAHADAFVSLDDARARGIHMSRLFLIVQDQLANADLDLHLVQRILHAFLVSHQGLSAASHLALRFDLLVRRQALVSEHSSWRSYPVTVTGDCRDGRTSFSLGVRVAYSSTCPCSAALARQLIQERFREDFADQDLIALEDVAVWLGEERSICATPHSQRSYADVQVCIASADQAPTFVEIIDLIEGALRTPVQAAVKREDEQEFARLNAANLMFCEDAVRRIRQVLDRDGRLSDYRIVADHVESLHPHSAMSIAVKGVPGGLRA